MIIRRTVLIFLCLAAAFAQGNEISPQKLNSLFGINIFGSDNSWSLQDFFHRIKLRFTSSGQRHHTFIQKTIAGVPAKEITVFTDDENKKIIRIMILFANRGDDTRRTSSKISHARTDLSRNISAVCGQKKRKCLPFSAFRTTADFWEIGNAGLYLESNKREYVMLHIVPDITAVEKSDPDKKDFSKNVVDNEFGDVYIDNIPMVDQGTKGYCVPATMARVFQYYGINLDMHHLADKGNSDTEDGTATHIIFKRIASIRRRSGLSYKRFSGISISKISRYIDKGYPVMWVMFSTDNLQQVYNFSRSNRSKYKDPKAWRRVLKRVKISKKHKDDQSHICLIIGYNQDTDEIAVSNSWGAAHIKPLWIPMKAARAVSQDAFFIFYP